MTRKKSSISDVEAGKAAKTKSKAESTKGSRQLGKGDAYRQADFWWDGIKWILFALMALATVYVAVYVKMPTQVLHTVVVIAMLAISTVLCLWTQRGQHLLSYARGAWQEMDRVTWPSKQETKSATLYVAVIVLIVSVLMWILDGLLIALIRLVTG